MIEGGTRLTRKMNLQILQGYWLEQARVGKVIRHLCFLSFFLFPFFLFFFHSFFYHFFPHLIGWHVPPPPPKAVPLSESLTGATQNPNSYLLNNSVTWGWKRYKRERKQKSAAYSKKRTNSFTHKHTNKKSHWQQEPGRSCTKPKGTKQLGSQWVTKWRYSFNIIH